MLQHAQDYHTIQAFEKIVELQEQVNEVKSQNQQLQVDLKDKNEFIERLSDRLACVERFIRSGVEIPDFVEADCPKSHPRSEPDRCLKSRVDIVEADHLQRLKADDIPDIVEADCLRTTPRRASAQKQTTKSQFHISLLDTEPSSEVKLPLNLLREEMDTQKSQLMQLSENMQTVQESITRHAIAIDEVRLRQDVIDVKTTNGVFIWKIPDVRRRYRDAVERKTISLYSPPFYTSPHGYRMCIRAYLNGDGIGKGSHVSVFLVLMRSEHDSLLSWPFKQSVRFTLINQVNSFASISEAFIPDLQSPSFQRPEAEMNVASGFPKFARQSVLQDETFTKGNIIFIKAKVDLTGLTLQWSHHIRNCCPLD